MNVDLDEGIGTDLTAPLFGKLLFLALGEARGRSHLPSHQELNRLLLEGADVPPMVRQIMHLDRDVIETCVREMTDYVFAAQRAGLVSRSNPSYKSGELQIGAYESKKLLSEYERQFGPVIEWLRGRVNSLSAVTAS